MILLYLLRIGDATSTSYESLLESLRERFKRAKEGLRDCINFGTWKGVVDAGE